MTIANLSKPLEKIEAARHVGQPTKIIANYPVGDEEARDASVNWRQWVAEERASVKGKVLWLMQPPLTVEEWAARYTPQEGQVH
ncbi:hypothetical protein [Methylobacterium oxalidis]|uniref:Uncharacterized protein n=1 Tax=Methylobacterium oxalidis TaxID=944322 RepID=A0A512J4E4_9HYPH|nr:hypothetical protein [Methylobacterium oxalidis]GEP04803.1 hypothetical protein MOX02_28410 [Methylobacterium oxalidis]GJE30503.1 hypothetical protein LDDCCGHA_0671 [Methylobacterium oxalidis]GLS63629.1 hypothetical protein GCM10007888_20100 [Methylobacterium oxalidis]